MPSDNGHKYPGTRAPHKAQRSAGVVTRWGGILCGKCRVGPLESKWAEIGLCAVCFSDLHPLAYQCVVCGKDLNYSSKQDMEPDIDGGLCVVHSGMVFGLSRKKHITVQDIRAIILRFANEMVLTRDLNVVV